MDYRFISCTFDAHHKDILDLFNHAIRTSTALYDYEERSDQDIFQWFQKKEQKGLPVIGLETPQRELVCMGTFGPFRKFPAYKYTVEHSVYVHQDHRLKGLGRLMLEKLIESAINNDIHTLIGAIDTNNHASIKLHESLGFTHKGTLPQIAFKFGKWLDLALYQLILETPEKPKDG